MLGLLVSSDYVGNLIYQDKILKTILTDNGYIEGGIYYFYVRDHLGNNRVVANASGGIVQSTQYYPFGMAFAEGSGTEQGKQPYKYNGKELDRTHELNWYDYSARQMDNAYGRFTSVDPLAEKYYSISPYAYVMNNPMNAVDFKGDSTTVLNLGYGTNQHMALLIQNDKGKWQYYSVNGDNVFSGSSSTRSHTGGREFNDIGIGEFDSPQQFLDSPYNSKGDKDDKEGSDKYGYTEGYVLPTTQEQDEQIKNKFVNIANNEEYRLNPLNPNQCATVTQRSLGSAGIKVTQTMPNLAIFGSRTIESRPYLPSTSFQVIMKNNPQGTYLKKKYR